MDIRNVLNTRLIDNTGDGDNRNCDDFLWTHTDNSLDFCRVPGRISGDVYSLNNIFSADENGVYVLSKFFLADDNDTCDSCNGEHGVAPHSHDDDVLYNRWDIPVLC